MDTRVFLLGDNIDTDQLAPGRYMGGGLEEMSLHCLETAYPNFSQLSSAGDIIVAGENFGAGSSREQAVEALRFLKISAVIALSFAGIFYRNAINLGLPVITCKDVKGIKDGDIFELSLSRKKLSIPTRNLSINLEPIPDNLVTILNSGGLISHLKKRLYFKAKPSQAKPSQAKPSQAKQQMKG